MEMGLLKKKAEQTTEHKMAIAASSLGADNKTPIRVGTYLKGAVRDS